MLTKKKRIYSGRGSAEYKGMREEVKVSQCAVDSDTQTECPTPVLLDSFISSFVHLASAW